MARRRNNGGGSNNGDGDVRDIANAISSAAAASSDLERGLRDVATKLEDLSRLISSLQLNGQLNSAAGAARDLSNELGNVAPAAASAGRTTSQSMNEVTRSMGETRNATEQVTGALSDAADQAEETSKKSSIGFGDVTEILGGVLSGVGGFVSSIFSAGKALLSFGASAIGIFAKVGMALLHGPLTLFDMLEEKAVDAVRRAGEIAMAYEKVRAVFGTLRGQIPQAIKSMTQFSTGAQLTGLSAFRVFGDTAERIEAYKNAFSAMGPLAEDFAKEIQKSGDAILYMQKGLGLTDEAQAKMMQLAKSLGSSLGDMYTDITKQVTGLAAATGLNQKNLARDVADAMTDVSHSSGVATEKIAASVAYIRKLGVEAKNVTAIMGAFKTFDVAAQNSAKLAQSFGMVVDTFQMMKAQTPAEKIEMLRKSMAAAGRDASTMNIQELELLSTSTGLDAATAKQVFSLKNQGMSYEQIMKQADKNKAKQIDQAKATKMLVDEIERMNTQMQASKGYFANFFDGISQGLGMNKDFRKLIQEIGQGFMMAQRAGRAFGKELPNIFPGLKDILTGLRDILKSERMGAFFRELAQAMKDLFGGKTTVTGFFDAIVGSATKVIEGAGPGGKKIMDGLSSIWGFFKRLMAGAIEFVGDLIARGMGLLTKGINKLVAWLTAPPGTKPVEEAGKKVGDGFVDQMSVALGNAGGKISTAWEPLSKALGDLWGTIKPKVLEALDDLISSIMKSLMTNPWAMAFLGVKAVGAAFNFSSSMKLVNAIKSLAAPASTAVAETMTAVGTSGAASATAAGASIQTAFTAGLGWVAGAGLAAYGVGKGLEWLMEYAGDKAQEMADETGHQVTQMVLNEKQKAEKSLVELYEKSLASSNITHGEALAMAQHGKSLAEVRAGVIKSVNEEAQKSLKERFKQDPEKYMDDVQRAAKSLADAQKDVAKLDEKVMIQVFTKIKNIQDAVGKLGVDEKKFESLSGLVNTVGGIVKSLAMSMRYVNEIKGEKLQSELLYITSMFTNLNLGELQNNTAFQATTDSLKGFSNFLIRMQSLTFKIRDLYKITAEVNMAETKNKLQQMISSFSKLDASGLENMGASFGGIAMQLKANNVEESVKTVYDVVHQISELDSILQRASGKKPIDLQAHLDRFVQKATLKSGVTSKKIPIGGRIEMNVTFNVSMNAAQVEAGVLQRPDSVIRNFLIHPSDATDQNIPKSPDVKYTPPNQSGGGSSGK